jgi:fructose-bisphosphate aldolase class II
MIVTTNELFQVAYGRFAVGAYNINNMEQTLGLFRGNLDSQAPFIIQISRGARSYADKRMLEAMIKAADEIFPEAVFAVHLDHGDLDTALDCIESGFYSSVMIDASSEPLEENIRITRQVVDAAHPRGISVEAELGQLGGVEEHVQVEEKNAHLTDPAEAEVFVRESGCDSLAVAIGTSHGAYKFSGHQGLHLEVAADIQRRGRRRVRESRPPRGDQGQYRHRRPAGVDARAPGVLPGQSGEVRPAGSRKGLCGRVCQVHRPQEPEAGLRRHP